MAYAQWINVDINARGLNINIKNARLEYGVFYANGNKDNQISDSAINSMVIHDGETNTICSRGRADAVSGTEGHFDLYDGGTKIGTFRWNCPWGSKNNMVNWSLDADRGDYLADVDGGNLYSGAIGRVRIRVFKR